MEERRTIFLDRDGVINRDSPDYIKHWDEFAFLPGSLQALELLNRNGFNVIVITNQSIINRGWVAPEVLADTHDRLLRAVDRAGGRIQDIFFCPHRPDEGCSCRKPEPGLILNARERYGLDLGLCIMVGDSAKDIEAGIRAGCGATILVQTGNGPAARQELAAKDLQPTIVVADLLEAARKIVSRQIPASH
jgi:D-glycero-D-manno-heptose 1,7-bisphosphate phosphatase